jgi:hypothetical protein
MKVGDELKIDFAGKKKDALVFKLFPSSVYLKVDFENDKGKLVKRKLSKVENKKTTSKKEKKK